MQKITVVLIKVLLKGYNKLGLIYKERAERRWEEGEKSSKMSMVLKRKMERKKRGIAFLYQREIRQKSQCGTVYLHQREIRQKSQCGTVYLHQREIRQKSQCGTVYLHQREIRYKSQCGKVYLHQREIRYKSQCGTIYLHQRVIRLKEFAIIQSEQLQFYENLYTAQPYRNDIYMLVDVLTSWNQQSDNSNTLLDRNISTPELSNALLKCRIRNVWNASKYILC